ncbi:hypothetical protein [Pyxidicoccus caerfyrddinensis]|uniref:hypothetical protein n=1 Tax=Pyxidicoccus caerfyrddinensis TaxID=2709663 RepID=UPI001F080703|nr:hypothetical protein [Pyxidicoccus caerfyrddinensis]
MSITGHFSSISQRGPIGHICTLRAPGLEVEVHARTRQDAEESAALVLTQELRRRELAARYPRAQQQTLSTRRPS